MRTTTRQRLLDPALVGVFVRQPKGRSMLLAVEGWLAAIIDLAGGK